MLHERITCEGVQVKLLWIPPQVGLREHDIVDTLTKLALDKEGVDHKVGWQTQILLCIQDGN